MLRWLMRLLHLALFALIAGAIAFAVSRLFGQDDDEDFDDFDDFDSSFDFQEIPLEIDVPAVEGASPHKVVTDTVRLEEDVNAGDNKAVDAMEAAGSEGAPGGDSQNALGSESGDMGNGVGSDSESGESNGGTGRLIDIIGIGPVYEARLHSIGVNSISALAHADAQAIADKLEVIGGVGAIADWISQAQSYPANER